MLGSFPPVLHGFGGRFGPFLYFLLPFFLTHGAQYINKICNCTSISAFQTNKIFHVWGLQWRCFAFFLFSLLVPFDSVTLHCCKEAQPHSFDNNRMVISYVCHVFSTMEFNNSNAPMPQTYHQCPTLTITS